MDRPPTFNLPACVAELGGDWGKQVLGEIAGARLKLFRTDGVGLPPETHPWDEALLMVEGELTLTLDDVDVTLRAGDLQVIPAGCRHAIWPGSKSAFLLFDPEP